MSPTDWNDDEQEPPAPLPAHERVWRHPSEVGEQVWHQTEPPLAIGRGLTAATGVIGSVLGVMLLWAMLSTEAGRGAVATVRSTIVTLTSHDFTTGVVTTLSSSATTTPGSGPTGSTSGTKHTLAGLANLPMPTWAVRSTAEVATSSAPDTDPASTPRLLAAPVNRGTLAITTSAAVAGQSTVQLELPDGTTETARVLFVDNRSGLAVLAPTTVQSTEAFTVATDIQPGDELTFMGDTPVTVTVAADGSIDGSWAEDLSMPEGAPVVNQRGELVALCTHEGGDATDPSAPTSGPTTTTPDSGDHMVTLETLADIQQAMSVVGGGSPVWIGVVINDDPTGALSIGAVDPSGPAAAAGLTAGDVILALDDMDIADCRTLIAHLSMHRPGDSVRLTVQRSDGTTAQFPITLAAPKTAL